MFAHRPILVPYDGSAYARVAADWARRLARAGSPTLVVTAMPSAAFRFETASAYRGDVGFATAELTAEAERFDTPVQTRLIEGPPGEAIAREATEQAVGVVVIGTRGRGAVAGILLGSTARAVLRATPAPVLVVHAPVPAIRRVVAAVDTGASARRVAEAARAFADWTGASLSLVSVLDVHRDLAAHPEIYGIPTPEWAALVAAHEARVFAPLRAVAGTADEVLRMGAPVDELRKEAEVRPIDVMVVGRKGETGRDTDAWTSVAFALAVRGPFATLIV